MRDFNNEGEMNVQGNLTINDNSQTEHKLYNHCSNEELLADRPVRAEN